jgi:uncharacterized protein with HEPN domain
MSRDFLLSLTDILENTEKAERFVGSMPYDKFVATEMASYAVVRCLEIIGEAVKNIPEDIRAKRPEVSWKDLAGLRDKCIHMYFGINHRRIWQVVKEDIPKYRMPIQTLIEELRLSEKK